MQYDFTVILSGEDCLSEEMADRLYEAGCDDGSPGSSGGIVSIDFHRDASSLEEAIRSAIASIHVAGYRAEKVELDADTAALWP